MRKGFLTVALVGAVTVGGAAACSKTANPTTTPSAKQPFVGVILPDTKSSVRWETADRPNLKAAFDAAGVRADIQNAQGDKTQFGTIADSMLNEGVNVLVIVDLDPGSGGAVIKKAHDQGVQVIDYDRLTAGGGADYYVSFDNVAVGTLQGQGLVKCLTAKNVTKPKIAELNGSPTDNNATLFASGYDAVLNPHYADGSYIKGPNQSVPDWDNAQGGTIFEQMLTANKDIKGVLAANDGLGNAVISVLKKNGLNGTVPVTGQDATLQGLQHILDGDQCMTVFKNTKLEADATSKLAIALAKGTQPPSDLSIVSIVDPVSKKNVPSVLETPEAIDASNMNDVVTAGGIAKSDLCAGAYAAKCTAAGIS
jgi:D-xylose transport system substrate-binding protein